MFGGNNPPQQTPPQQQQQAPPQQPQHPQQAPHTQTGQFNRAAPNQQQAYADYNNYYYGQGYGYSQQAMQQQQAYYAQQQAGYHAQFQGQHPHAHANNPALQAYMAQAQAAQQRGQHPPTQPPPAQSEGAPQPEGAVAQNAGQLQQPKSRWGEPMQSGQIEQFIEMYMPWTFEQRRRAHEQGLGSGNLGVNYPRGKEANQSDTATNLLKVEEGGGNKFAAIEQTQQYKQLLRYNPAAAAAMKAGVKCPERLAIYIERAFSKCISDSEREFMRDQLEKICLTSKNRGDFFIKQWELMPLPCLQRESTSYQAMNDRLIRGDQNTSLPYHDQLRNQDKTTMEQPFPQRQQMSSGRGPSGNNSASQLGGVGSLGNNFAKGANVTPFSTRMNQPEPQSRDRYPMQGLSKQDSQSRDSNSLLNRGLQAGNPQHLQHFSNAQNFSSFNSAQNATAQDMDMYKRLKRLEKFEDQLKQKNMSVKPKLVSGPVQGSGYLGYGPNGGMGAEESNMDLDELAKHLSIKGSCMTVEKSYFRLTQAPDPCDVRPEPVLQEALKMLESKWNNKKADYKYIDDQFRSLRQDLTVQRIQNDFCVKVYETHARIALEEADLDQFNQCQTQLRYLYRLGYKGNRIEFLGYQFLYYVFCELETETLRMLKTLTPEEKQQEPILHALKTRNALVQCNYGRFFKLYLSAPGKAPALVDVFIDKIRIQCLQKLVVGFIATNIEVGYLATLLAFSTAQELENFLQERGCTFIADPNGGGKKLDCRASLAPLKKAPLRVRRCKK